MSLRPDDRHRRSRSKSPGGRERSRSRSHVREPHNAADGGPQYELRQPSGHQPYATSTNEPITMGNYADLPPEQRPGYYNPGNAPSYSYTSAAPSTTPGVAYAPQSNVQYSTQQFGYSATPSSAHARDGSNGGFQYAAPPDKLTYTAKPAASQQPPPPVRHTPQQSNPPYQQSAHPQYTATPQSPHPQYNIAPQAPQPPQQQQQHHAVQPSYPPPPPMGAHAPHSGDSHRAGSNGGIASTHDGRKVVEMVPSGGGKINAPPSPGMRPHSLSVGGGGRPDGLSGRMDRLSVSGNRPDVHMVVPGGFPGGSMGGGMPPGSPLLEAYHGTYQSISPMPGAMLMDDDLDHIPSLDSLSPRDHRDSGKGRRRAHSSSRRSPSRRSPSPPHNSRPKDRLALEAYGHREPSREREKRRVKIYDATEDAYALVDAMSGKVPDASILIDILPMLSHDQMLELRSEYKRHCKVQGRGINIAKHIKLKTSGNFGKIAYVTALGKYEGEGYWANYWYQSNSAKRELLIEALMGRQNHEIREIKDAFKDKRYSDNLERCMDKELKADKFRKAVLMALQGVRQEESDVWPPEYRARDVDTLYKAIRAREGGETAMLEVVCMRSDAHLREVLRGYERTYHASFARDALRKSNNLVGEVIAHILNGVINRPARDAMLLNHALMDLIEPASDPRSSSSSKLSSGPTKHERQQRFELLISRLVRLHWDRMHLQRVKSEYEEKYGRMVEEDLEEATKGDFREFCIQLCQGGPGGR